MQFRWGSVLEVEKIDPVVDEPDDLTTLKDHWYRRPKYTLVNQESICGPKKVTLGFGAKVEEGKTGRAEDDALWNVVATPGDQPDLLRDGTCFDELMANVVNEVMNDDPDSPVRYTVWLQADVPDDVLDPWMDGAGAPDKPDSLLTKMRGYVGIIDDETGPTDFDDEKAESSPAATREEPVHFVNVIADVNNDGVIDILDEDDELEEGLGDGPGLLVFYDPDAAAPNLPNADPNLAKIQVRLSQPVGGGDYSDYEVWISTSSSDYHFWQDDHRSAKFELKLPEHVWVVPLQPGGDTVDVFVGCVTWTAADDLDFYLVKKTNMAGTDDLGPRRAHLDRIRVKQGNFGVDVDSQNDGDVDQDDDLNETTFPGMVVVRTFGTNEYPVQLRKEPRLDSVGGTPTPAATLQKLGAGGIVLRDSAGNAVLDDGANDTSEQFSIQDLHGNGTLDFTLTGVSDGPVTLRMTLERGGRIFAFDLAQLTVVSGNLEGWFANCDWSTNPPTQWGTRAAPLAENEEEALGVIAVANLNDMDQDGILDYYDGPVAGEKDMCRLRMHAASDPDAFDGVRIMASGPGDPQLWQDAAHSVHAAASYASPQAGTHQDLFVDFKEATPVRGVNLDYEARVVGTQNWVKLDRVKATAIWFTLSRSWSTHTPGSPGGPNSANWEDIDDPTMRANMAAILPAANLSWYGAADHQVVGGANTWHSARICFEFEIAPVDLNAAEFGLFIDVTRQMNSQQPGVAGAAGSTWVQQFLASPPTFAWTAIPPNGVVNWNRTWPAGSEVPNDDLGPHDNDNTLTNGHVYSYDAPGAALAPGGGEAFRTMRSNFREFVRVRFDNNAFAGGQVTHPNGEIAEQGSRASPKVAWAFRANRVRNAAGTQMVPDTTLSTLSGPAIPTPGTTYTLGGPPAPPSEGFDISFAGSTYTLAGNLHPVPSTNWGVLNWTVGFPGVVTVNLTTASPNFFQFSLFTTTTAYAGGKTNEVRLTAPLPLDAP
jgi:hypothetical protein